MIQPFVDEERLETTLKSEVCGAYHQQGNDSET